MEKLRMGVIGYGNMGTWHVEYLKDGKVPRMELTAVADTDPKKRADMKRAYPDVPVFETAEDMYKSGLCDIVLIAVPHYDHPDLAIKAFEYGLHVVVEKPAGVYTKQVKAMNEAAARSDRFFGIMYNQRTNPVYQKLKKMIEEGQLGAIKRVTWIITNWYRPQAYHASSGWRSTWAGEGGGTLINQNPHQLDLWQWMIGMPDRIYAKASFGKYYDIEVEDDVAAFFEYDNGMTGQYITSTGEAPGTNRLEVACDMGKLVIENNQMIFHRNVISEREHNRTNTAPFGHVDVTEVEVETDGLNPQHIGVLNAWAGAILRGTDLVARGEEGINGVQMSNAMHLSAFLGKAVELPVDEKQFTIHSITHFMRPCRW